MTIHTLAREAVVTVAPDTPASDVADLLAREQVGSAVVVDGDRPVGIVTDRDLAIDVLGVGTDPAAKTAGDLVEGELFTVESGTGVFETIDAMREANVRRVPVVEDGRLVGIVTLDDLLVLLSDELANLTRIIEAESPPYAAKGA